VSVHRNRRVIVYWDEAGNRYEDSWRTAVRGPSLAAIPPNDRLVSAYCDQRHLMAALVANGDAPPLVMVHNALGPVPAYVLVADGFAYAMVSTDGQTASVGAFGTPRKSWLLSCPSCPEAADCWLDAQPLRDALSRGQKRTGLRRGEPT
jgi:hypothetical protein